MRSQRCSKASVLHLCTAHWATSCNTQTKQEVEQLQLKLVSLDASALDQARQLLTAEHRATRLEAQLKDMQGQGLTGGRESASFLCPVHCNRALTISPAQSRIYTLQAAPWLCSVKFAMLNSFSITALTCHTQASMPSAHRTCMCKAQGQSQCQRTLSLHVQSTRQKPMPENNALQQCRVWLQRTSCAPCSEPHASRHQLRRPRAAC